MAQYRQSGHYNSSNGAPDLISAGIRGSLSSHLNHIQQKPGRFRRSGRSDKGRLGFPIGAVIVVLCLVLFVTLLAYYYLSTDNRRDENHVEDDEMKNDLDFLANVTRTDTFKVFGFGRGGSAVHGRDSRYWDRDDRRRDDDYNEDDVDHLSKVDRNESSKRGRNLVKVKNGMENFQDGQRGAGLYNEDGLKELKKYETEYEASVHNSGESRKENGIEDHIIDNENSGEQSSEAWDSDNEYDDGIGSHDFRVDKYHDSEPDKVKHSDMRTLHHDDDDDDDDSSVSSNFPSIKSKYQIKGAGSFSSQNSGIVDSDSKHSHAIGGQSTGKLKSESRRRPSRRKFSGSSCEMKLLNSTTQIVEPIENRKFVRFSLQYIEMENPNAQEEWKPRFAGHQSLQEREESFLVHDQKIHCGFVKGPEGTPSTGFDLAEDDVNFISRCHIAVISCIFGNSDRLRSPVSKMVTRLSRKNVCFVMFVDEATFQTLSSEGQMPHREGFIGLWRIVVVKNLPYEDMRRVGKIPKLLPHRLFPSARYSIWLDSKLRLQRDPLIILEYFLWRKGHEYAISNHYDRHCIWEEVAQNKRLNKYNHTIIDQQFSFYQADGLKRFNASDPQKLLPSNVPEGSLILRAHTPMSNLFSCLWFNEVDRFTSRDQLSFGYTYQKLRSVNSGKSFRLNMFKDCERRAVAKLFHHRSQEKRANLQQATE